MGLMLTEQLAGTTGCLGNCNGGRRDCTLPGVCNRRHLPLLTEADLDRAIARRQRPLPAPLAPRQRGPRRIAAERQRRNRLLWRLAALCAALLLTLAFTRTARADAAALQLGVHLYTAHFSAQYERAPQRPHNGTPGVYVIGPHYTAGLVRNSHARWSAYAGYVARLGPLDLTLGAISGYRYRRVTGPTACPPEWTEQQRCEHGHECWTEVGSTHAVLRPLLAVSYAIPLEHITPRITLLGKGVHLSIERSFGAP